MILKRRDRLIVMIEQKRTVEATFNVVDETIDSMITIMIFSHCKSNSCEEVTEEQRHTDDNYICSRRRNLSLINNEFVSTSWVSLHSERNVTFLMLLKNTLWRSSFYFVSDFSKKMFLISHYRCESHASLNFSWSLDKHSTWSAIAAMRSCRRSDSF